MTGHIWHINQFHTYLFEQSIAFLGITFATASNNVHPSVWATSTAWYDVITTEFTEVGEMPTTVSADITVTPKQGTV
jgi:hypothetical protein